MNEREHNLDRQTDRQSNFELLRIIAMLMIVSLHFVGNSGYCPSNDSSIVNTVWYRLCCLGGLLGNNIFVMISGYFLIKKDDVRLSKTLRFWLQVFFYSIVLFALMAAYEIFILHSYTFSWSAIKEAFFPLIYNQWWFASTYFVLMVLSPFINRMLVKLSYAEYSGLLLFLFFVLTVIPTVFRVDTQYSHLLWFVFLYCLAGFVRLFKNDKPQNKKRLYNMAAIGIAFLLLVYVVSTFLNESISAFDWILYAYSSMNKMLVFLLAFLLFILFRNISIPYNKQINTIASATFGVYLIHENQYIRQFLSNHLYSKIGLDSNWFVPYTIIAINLIFIVCVGIDLIRKNLIEKRYLRILDNAAMKIQVWFRLIADKKQ